MGEINDRILTTEEIGRIGRIVECRWSKLGITVSKASRVCAEQVDGPVQRSVMRQAGGSSKK